MSEKTYHGSCACGKIRFEVCLDLGTGTFKCNCTVCLKSRLWGATVKSGAFKLLSGEGDLTVWGDRIHHHFCKHCGIKVYGRPALGGEIMVVMMGTLDDFDPAEWGKVPVKYIDGRNDNWSGSPQFTAHL